MSFILFLGSLQDVTREKGQQYFHSTGNIFMLDIILLKYSATYRQNTKKNIESKLKEGRKGERGG